MDLPHVIIVPKANSEIRLCLDMRQANRAIIRERYPIPTVDELLQSMNGSMIFSKLDLKWGYHQLELTPEFRQITTFAVHNEVYRYKCLIFGVSSASEQYQHEIAHIHVNNPAHSLAVLNCSGNANRPKLSRTVTSRAEPYHAVEKHH